MPHTVIRLLVMFVLCFLSVYASHAQGPSEAGPRGQPISRRSLGEYARILDLSPSQRDALKALFDGYWSSYARRRDGFSGEMQKLHNPEAGQARPTRRTMGEIIGRFAQDVEKLEASFFDDVRQLLTAEQDARFDRVTRERRRETGLRFCFVSGERLNLDAITRKLSITREGAVGASLDEWELEIDRLLVQKDAVIRRVMDRAFDGDDEQPDPKLIEELLGQLLEQGFRIRDLNRRFAREISQTLPEDLRPAFEREIRLGSFPRIYVASGAEATGRAIAARDDLTPEQRSTLGEELPRCERDFADLNARIASIVETKEEKAPGNALAAMEGRNNPPKDDLSEALAERIALNTRWTERLLKVLTPPQREQFKPPEVPPLAYGKAFNLDPESGGNDDHSGENEAPEPQETSAPR